MLLLSVFLSVYCLVNIKPSCAGLSNRQLIVLSLPDNYYYANNTHDIASFAKELASKAQGHDQVMVLYPSKFIAEGRKFDLGVAKCLSVNQPIDLWMRDFGMINPKRPVKFRYAPKYLSKSTRTWVDSSFKNLLYSYVQHFSESTVALDGGNVVDNGDDKAIISKRIFEENDKDPETVKEFTENGLSGMQVAYIPDPQDTTGHSDGIVSFVEKDTVMISDIGDAYFYNQIKNAIENAFPDVKTVPLPCPDLKNSNWRKFRSAFGAYANSLVTDSTAYVPIFKREPQDGIALDIQGRIQGGARGAEAPLKFSKIYI